MENFFILPPDTVNQDIKYAINLNLCSHFESYYSSFFESHIINFNFSDKSIHWSFDKKEDCDDAYRQLLESVGYKQIN